MRSIKAIFKKQIKDLIKNKETLIMFLVFPGVAFLMTQFIARQNPDIPNTTFVAQFMSMFSCMVIIQTTALIIAEEKEKKSLKFLMMAGVKQYEYIIGIGGALAAASAVIGLIFAWIGELGGQEFWIFLGFFILNVLISILIGATCGLFSRNVQHSTAIATPIAFIFGFLPMFASFNENLYNIVRYVYATQFAFLTFDFSVDVMEPLLITGANFVIFAILFAIVYRVRGLAKG